MLRFLLRDLYGRNEAERNELQQLRQEVQNLQNKQKALEKQQEKNFQRISQNAERSERSEKRLDCLEHYRRETEKRMKSDDETTISLAHRTEQIETILKEQHFLKENLQLFNKKTYSQAGEDAILMYLCAMMGIAFSDCIYLDLGANKPIEMSNTYFFYEQGARGVLLEANPLLIPELKAKRPEDIILNQAVSGKSGEQVEFHILNLDGLSKIGDISELLANNPEAELQQTISLETISYEEIIENYLNQKAPVILNLDTEGMEMEILQSIPWEKYRPLFIILEMIPYSQKLSAGVKDQELLQYLASKDYLEYAFTGINSIFMDKRQYELYLH